MNALIHGEQLYDEFDEYTKKNNKTYFGDVLATAIVVFFTISSLTISGWSAFIYITGNYNNGGPLGHIFKSVYTVMNASGVIG
jgi:hypothetical protein